MFGLSVCVWGGGGCFCMIFVGFYHLSLRMLFFTVFKCFQCVLKHFRCFDPKIRKFEKNRKIVLKNPKRVVFLCLFVP